MTRSHGTESTREGGERWWSGTALAWLAVVGLGLTAVAAAPSVATESRTAGVSASAALSPRVDRVEPALGGGKFFVDPYPVHKKGGWGDDLPVFSGTRKRLLPKCTAGVTIDCPAGLNSGLAVTFAPDLEANLPDGPKYACRRMKAFHPYQSNGDNPRWHMALAVKFTKKDQEGECTNEGKNVIYHAHPKGKVNRKGVPLNWVIDTRLLGHWKDDDQVANYNPRYVFDKRSRKLYLISIRGIEGTDGPSRFAIVARHMETFNVVVESEELTEQVDKVLTPQMIARCQAPIPW